MTNEQTLVLAFATAQMNRRVGVRGECWDLAENALTTSGLARPGDELYVWGTLIPLSSAGPGDIIQFDRFENIIEISSTDGSSSSEDLETGPNHTAIIKTIGRNAAATVYHQNFEANVRRVTQWVFYLTGSTEETRIGQNIQTQVVSIRGSYIIYRPNRRR